MNHEDLECDQCGMLLDKMIGAEIPPQWADDRPFCSIKCAIDFMESETSP